MTAHSDSHQWRLGDGAGGGKGQGAIIEQTRVRFVGSREGGWGRLPANVAPDAWRIPVFPSQGRAARQVSTVIR